MKARAGGHNAIRPRGLFMPALMSLTLSLPLPAAAQAPPADPSAPSTQPTAVREPDAPPNTPTQLSEHWSIGFRIGEEVEVWHDSDLNGAAPDNYFSHEPQAQIAVHYNLPNTFRFFSILRIRKEFAIQEQGVPFNRRYRLEFDDAYVATYLPHNMVASAGRIRMPDYRSWLFSNSQSKNDAAHVIQRAEGRVLQAAVVTRDLIPRNLLHPVHIDRTLNYVASAEYNLTPNIRAAGVLIYHDNLAFDDRDRMYFNARSRGTVLGALDYWTDLSVLRGNNGADKMRGYAVDVGATYKFDDRWTTHVTASYAFATGDDDPTDGVDRRYRQTGVHENRHHFGGVSRFKYYGELLDPELSNIGVLTLAAGFKPSLLSSVDVIYHRYRRQKSGGAVSLAIDAAPAAPGHDLGQEVDVVLGYRDRSAWEFEAFVGYFAPGAIFAANRTDSVRGLFKTKYNF